MGTGTIGLTFHANHHANHEGTVAPDPLVKQRPPFPITLFTYPYPSLGSLSEWDVRAVRYARFAFLRDTSRTYQVKHNEPCMAPRFEHPLVTCTGFICIPGKSYQAFRLDVE